MWKVASFKDRMIQRARNDNYDYLFLIDSDIVLHPHTIEQLLLAKKDILSNVFWTKWHPTLSPEPQVWLSDTSTQYVINDGEQISREEAWIRRQAFLDQLRMPGVFEVGGLGACTLISKHALHKGVSFRKMRNLTFWGEDRHFCVRAVALGLSLFVDTHLPACHIYRESALCGVSHYKWACEHQRPLPLIPIPRITLSMVVKNEANKYLRRVLESARNYVSDAVIIDDASTDNTVEICREVLKDIPLHLVQNTESKFANEITLRKQQWEETIRMNPDWMVILDADEVFEKAFEVRVKDLICDNDVDVYLFRLFDFWNEESYRDDQYWGAHTRYSPFLIRYKPDIPYHWKETAQHCGRMPASVMQFPKQKNSDLRLKHYGWASPETRLAKYHRYMQLDPGARFGWKEQYDSILDPNPNLVAWKE
jgi:glycosyltransferase involved in cell wall biosynthesis